MSRGMKKFLPFASLKEQAVFLRAMQVDKQRIEKPEISEDTKEEINTILQESADKTLLFYYFANGFIYTVEDKIKKIDLINKQIVLSEIKISFTNLLNIEIID